MPGQVWIRFQTVNRRDHDVVDTIVESELALGKGSRPGKQKHDTDPTKTTTAIHQNQFTVK